MYVHGKHNVRELQYFRPRRYGTHSYFPLVCISVKRLHYYHNNVCKKMSVHTHVITNIQYIWHLFSNYVSLQFVLVLRGYSGFFIPASTAYDIAMFISYLISMPALIHYYVYVLSYFHLSFDPLLCLCPILFPSQLWSITMFMSYLISMPALIHYFVYFLS